VNPTETALVMLAGGVLAGTLGSLTGLGGGVIIVPMLTIAFGVPVREAIGVSLISIIATSSGAATRFLGTGLTSLRAGTFLQIAASTGAVLGALAAGRLGTNVLFVVFGVVLLYSAVSSLGARASDEHGADASSPAARALRLGGAYRTPDGWRPYNITNVPAGFAVMVLAGFLSALLGIGSGAFKVLAMDRLMRFPFKVSTATSNFMIGVTAATSAGFYLTRGEVPPLVAGPIVLGVLGGSALGASLVSRAPVRALRLLFATILSVVAVQMLLKGVRS
jgi:uncharacterized membrane protein YfcA